MLWAFVSDIHGNRRALDVAASIAEARGADRYACLGDALGRGDPAGCVAWVIDHAAIAIAGNRDLDHIDLVSGDLQDAVRTWPREYVGSTFVLTHGDPGSHKLLRSTAEGKEFRGVPEYLEQLGVRLWLYGHTHHARVWSLDDPSAPLNGGRVRLDGQSSYVVNVGSVGHPFAGKGGPSMVLYEEDEGWLEIVPLPNSGSEATRSARGLGQSPSLKKTSP
jgi:predicted phosphodiesterase